MPDKYVKNAFLTNEVTLRISSIHNDLRIEVLSKPKLPMPNAEIPVK